MGKFKKVGIVGIFENYTNRAVGPAFLVAAGVEYNTIKQSIQSTFDNDCSILFDPYYNYPASVTFGAKEIGTNLTYLHTQIAYELMHTQKMYKPLVVMHTVIDIYAEIMMNYGKQRWLEPVLQRQIESYDKLIHIPLEFYVPKPNPVQEKYDTIIRRIMHDFTGNYFRCSAKENILSDIRAALV
jgi:hypothetical protein